MDQMKQRIRPLKHKIGGKPVMFRFRVFFENLTEEELKRVHWALTFGDSDCAHKLGRAKPLGFGSARISVEETKLRRIDPETGVWVWVNDLVERIGLEPFPSPKG